MIDRSAIISILVPNNELGGAVSQVSCVIFGSFIFTLLALANWNRKSFVCVMNILLLVFEAIYGDCNPELEECG